jgi:hypothetical protein
MFDRLSAAKFPDLPKNMTGVSKELVNAIVKERDHVGINEVGRAFKVFGSNGIIYFIHNNEQFFGYNKVLKEFHFHLVRRGTKLKADMRAPSDAVRRVAAVMFHKDNFRAVEAILSGARSDRAGPNQSVDPPLAWAKWMH